MTEFEKKMLLTKDEYEHLMDFFSNLYPSGKLSSTKQINYYFDTDKLDMNRQNITCRVRYKDGQYKGMMKRHHSDTLKSTEEEMELYDGVTNNSFIDMGMEMYGSMTTERCVVLENVGLVVVLDKNKYLGFVDYELEIEYLPANEAEARIIFHCLTTELMVWHLMHKSKDEFTQSKTTLNKSNRFFDKYTIINQKKQTNLSERADREESCCAAYKPENCDPDAYLKKYTEN